MKNYYHEFELKRGICSKCGQETNELLILDGICVSCAEKRSIKENGKQIQNDNFNTVRENT